MWNLAFWKAAAERMIRGAAITVAGVYFGGDVVFDLFTVNSWADLGSLALSGAVGSLILSLGGNALTGTGPSFNKTETVDEVAGPKVLG